MFSIVEIRDNLGVKFWMRSVNSKSFIFGSDFVFFCQEKMNSDSNMKSLLFNEGIAYVTEISEKVLSFAHGVIICILLYYQKSLLEW